MANLLGHKDLARVVSAAAARSSKQSGYSQAWAHLRAIENGVVSLPVGDDESCEAALYADIISNSLFIPDSNVLDSSDEVSGYLNLSKFGPAAFYRGNFYQSRAATIEQKVVDVCQRVDWLALQDTVDIAIRFLDTSAVSHSRRAVVLSSFGLSELLFRLGIPYGDNSFCSLFLDELFFYIAYWAYKVSVELAIERGPYRGCDRRLASAHPFVARLQKGINARGLNYPLVEEIAKHGLRNQALVGHPSAGYPGFVCGTSNGIDPFLQLSWSHRGMVGECVEVAAVARDYLDFSGVKLSVGCFPDYFLTAATVSNQDSMSVHTVAQYWSDRALVDHYESDSPEVEISDWFPSNAPTAMTPPATIDPSLVELNPTAQDVVVKTCTVTQDGPGMVVNLTIEIRQPEFEKRELLRTVPAVIPASYDYQAQRSTIPAPPSRKK